MERVIKLTFCPKNGLRIKSDEYLEKHLIPKDRELWRLDNFEEFVETRNQMILEKFDYLIYKEEASHDA